MLPNLLTVQCLMIDKELHLQLSTKFQSQRDMGSNGDTLLYLAMCSWLNGLTSLRTRSLRCEMEMRVVVLIKCDSTCQMPGRNQKRLVSSFFFFSLFIHQTYSIVTQMAFVNQNDRKQRSDENNDGYNSQRWIMVEIYV